MFYSVFFIRRYPEVFSIYSGVWNVTKGLGT